MHRENPSTLNSLPARHGLPGVSFGQQPPVQQETITSAPEKSESLLGKHGGKLAVGAAAMLGVAIFYKWREQRMAKEEPEEYALLRRLKQAVKNEERMPRVTHHGQTVED